MMSNASHDIGGEPINGSGFEDEEPDSGVAEMEPVSINHKPMRVPVSAERRVKPAS